MRQVAYVSAATPGLGTTFAQLTEILAVARRNNARDGISGMLLQAGETFFQVIEGPPPAVGACLGRIRMDRRHVGMHMMLDRVSEERLFPEWSMGFRARAPRQLPLEPETDHAFALSAESLAARLCPLRASAPEIVAFMESFYRINAPEDPSASPARLGGSASRGAEYTDHSPR